MRCTNMWVWIRISTVQALRAPVLCSLQGQTDRAVLQRISTSGPCYGIINQMMLVLVLGREEHGSSAPVRDGKLLVEDLKASPACKPAEPRSGCKLGLVHNA